MSAELAEHAVGLATASSAAEEDFEHLALQQPHLRRVATRRPSNPRPWARRPWRHLFFPHRLCVRNPSSLTAVHHCSLSGSGSSASASHVALSTSAGISIT